jgi:hypothetical protein
MSDGGETRARSRRAFGVGMLSILRLLFAVADWSPQARARSIAACMIRSEFER